MQRIQLLMRHTSCSLRRVVPSRACVHMRSEHRVLIPETFGMTDFWGSEGTGLRGLAWILATSPTEGFADWISTLLCDTVIADGRVPGV